jgi:RNAse (barnase) inhibitor barstar
MSNQAPDPMTSATPSRVEESELPSLLASAGRLGVEVHRIGEVEDRADLHRRFRRSWSFPAYYGNNFDALADVLGDLSWREPAPRALILGPLNSLKAADPEAYRQLAEVLADAAEGWEHTPTPLRVIELVRQRRSADQRG